MILFSPLHANKGRERETGLNALEISGATLPSIPSRPFSLSEDIVIRLLFLCRSRRAPWSLPGGGPGYSVSVWESQLLAPGERSLGNFRGGPSVMVGFAAPLEWERRRPSDLGFLRHMAFLFGCACVLWCLEIFFVVVALKILYLLNFWGVLQ